MFLSVSLGEEEPEIITDEKAFFASATPADLLFLRDQVNDLLYNAPEYESVPVPAGIYMVGKDIPEGKWTLSTAVNSAMRIGNSLKENGKEIDYWASDYYATETELFFLNTYLYNDNQIIKTVQQTVDFPSGYYVAVSRGTIYFTTYTGQPDFLFYANELPSKKVTQRLDLSSYDFSSLITLKNRLNLMIWNSFAWKRIIIPAGLYQIGKDIPAGNWTIESPEEYTRVVYGTNLNKHHMNLSINDAWNQEIENVNYWNYKEGEDLTSVDLAVSEDSYLMINENTCASFSPSAGKKKSLGFKQFATEDNNAIADDQITSYQLFTFSDDSSLPTNITNSGSPTAVQTIVFDNVEYELMDYDDVARNPNNNKGKKIYFIGKVIQVVESSLGTSTSYRVKIDNSDSIVLVKRITKAEPRVLEDDHVIVCGTCTGVESYKSVLGGTITIPGCIADDISDAVNLNSRIPTPAPASSPIPEQSLQRQDDPLIITSCTPGEKPRITLLNNSGKKLRRLDYAVSTSIRTIKSF